MQRRRCAMHAKPIATAISAFLLALGFTAVTQATAEAQATQQEGIQAAKAAGEREAKAQLATRAAEVLDEIMQAPDQGIPVELLNRAECVAVFPSTLKAGFLVGVEYGYGLVSCRQPGSDGWGAPAFFTLAGRSLGLQIGAKATDLILLVMNENGVNSLLKSKVSLGADLGVTAGPVGRDASASTDLLLGAGILRTSEGIAVAFVRRS
jgi:lipid-binding SYLF domain-containing protein